MKIEDMRLTDEELRQLEVTTQLGFRGAIQGAFIPRSLLDAQIAKALYGAVADLSESRAAGIRVAAHWLRESIRETGIERPTAAQDARP